MNTPEQPHIAFDASQPHHAQPKLRPIRTFPARKGDEVIMAVADAKQISDKVIYMPIHAQLILQEMNGTQDIDAIVEKVGRGLQRPIVEQLVGQLDSAGLLESPHFEEIRRQFHEAFDASTHLPPGASADFADALLRHELGDEATDAQRTEQGPGKVREMLDKWMDEALKDAERPSFDALPRAVIAPHLDYWRGWPNYAHIYGRMRIVDRPDRVIILGTNHFGYATGVCGCDKGYETLFGACELDRELVDALKGHLGEKGDQLFAHRFDHEHEHSIELHLPWIQHVFGSGEGGGFPKVFGALIHDPAVNNGDPYDDKGVGLLEFVEAMKRTLGDLAGTTLIISSADLSHVGPAFGDQTPVVGDSDETKQLTQRVLNHDREMLQLIAEAKPEELVASMAWQQNPTRWCSTGNIVAAMKLTDADKVDVLHYMASADQQGMALVSSCAAVIH